MVSSKFLTNITLMMAKLHSISRMELNGFTVYTLPHAMHPPQSY